MLYGPKLREIHIVQLMLAELLGPKPPANVTISSLFKEITFVAESFPYSWETNLRKLETPQVEIVSDTIYSRVHITSDEVFSKILKKPSIVQK